MSHYGRFRTGDNQIDVEKREIAKVAALERIARALEALLEDRQERTSRKLAINPFDATGGDCDS